MSRHLNRRQFVGGASAAAFAVGGLGVSAAFAQESTPEAELHAQEGATPEAVVLDAIPAEFTDLETNWPVEGGNLAMTREAVGSGISVETIGTLGVAWSTPITNAAPFGALVANPTVVGTTVFLQDAMSNIYAIDIETGAEIWTTIP